MTRPTRRDVLGSLATCSIAMPWGVKWGMGSSGSGPGGDQGEERLGIIASRILATPRAECFDMAGELLRGGATWRELEGAIFLAAVRAVRADPPGFASHVILETESVFQLAESGPAEEALLPVLFHLDDLKFYKGRQGERQPWNLKSVEGVPEWNAAQAEEELLAALKRGEPEGADVAATALYREAGPVKTTEVLWTHGVGDLDGVGHKVIHAAHTQRAMARIGRAVEEAALRNLAIGLARPTEESAMADLMACRELAQQLPQAWREGEARPDDSLALAHSFLTSTSEQAREEALNALKEGAGADTIWDAVRLGACDLFARRPSLLPVHPTTVCNALAHMSRTTHVEQTARVSLLQAVSTIPVMRDALAERGATPLDGSVLERLLEEPDGELSLEEALEEPDPQNIRAYLKRAQDTGELTARMRSLLYRGCVQNHQVKYSAALFEDVRRCSPRWRSVLLAPAFGYLPGVRDGATEVYERSLVVRASAY